MPEPRNRMGEAGSGEPADRFTIETLEGSPVHGELWGRRLLRGRRALLVELHASRGTVTPPHRHAHESYLYVVMGKIRTHMGAETRLLGPSDAMLHPAGVEHFVEALEDTVWVEVKTPAEEPW